MLNGGGGSRDGPCGYVAGNRATGLSCFFQTVLDMTSQPVNSRIAKRFTGTGGAGNVGKNVYRLGVGLFIVSNDPVGIGIAPVGLDESGVGIISEPGAVSVRVVEPDVTRPNGSQSLKNGSRGGRGVWDGRIKNVCTIHNTWGILGP